MTKLTLWSDLSTLSDDDFIDYEALIASDDEFLILSSLLVIDYESDY